MTAPDHVQFGKGGMGRYDDAVNFRRARLEVDGWMYEVVDFFCEYDFLNTLDVGQSLATPQTGIVLNTPVPTDLWASVNSIPYIGTVRAGNMKPPISLEHLISSRFLDFMERSEQFDAFIEEGNNGFSQGIQILNWTRGRALHLPGRPVQGDPQHLRLGTSATANTGRSAALPVCPITWTRAAA